MVYALHFLGNVDALRAVYVALPATDAVVGLPETRHAAVVPHQERPTRLTVTLALRRGDDVALVHTLVVMQQHRRDVDAIGARHAVLAVVARDGGVLQHELRRLFEEILLIVREGRKG